MAYCWCVSGMSSDCQDSVVVLVDIVLCVGWFLAGLVVARHSVLGDTSLEILLQPLVGGEARCRLSAVGLRNQNQ